MLEWYRANAGVEDVMKDTEELVAMLSSGRVQLGERTIDTRTPVERWTVCEAFERFADIGEDETLDLAANDEERYFQLMVESVQPGLARSIACVPRRLPCLAGVARSKTPRRSARRRALRALRRGDRALQRLR